LAAALHDQHAIVREHAAKLSEPMLRRTSSGGSIDHVVALARDPEARVRFQAAFTLGESSDPRAADALALLLGDDDENIRNAALSSVAPHAAALPLKLRSASPNGRAKSAVPMLQRLAARAGDLNSGRRFELRPQTCGTQECFHR
jgi:HEAT repeat protein